MQIEPYLFFDGRCEEALAFYHEALGAEVSGLMRYRDNPDGMHGPPAARTRSCTRSCASATPASWHPTGIARASLASRASAWR